MLINITEEDIKVSIESHKEDNTHDFITALFFGGLGTNSTPIYRNPYEIARNRILNINPIETDAYKMITGQDYLPSGKFLPDYNSDIVEYLKQFNKILQPSFFAPKEEITPNINAVSFEVDDSKLEYLKND